MPYIESSKAINHRTSFHEHITVCICTFRRKEVFDAIASVQNQKGVGAREFSILVIDNDENDKIREEVEIISNCSPVEIRYFHAPAKNISVARNAALVNSNSRWIAFLDDDETATQGWLASLRRGSLDAEVVLGPVLSDYPAGAPAWLLQCDFHSTRAEADLANAYCGNVLIDLNFVKSHNVKFAIELGRIGGEDTVFFRQLAIAGARFAYAPDAIVLEPVAPTRANMRWVMRRKIRAGQTHGLVCRMFNRRAYAALWVSAPAKMAASGLAAILSGPGSNRSRRWLARACFHLGALRYRVHPSILEEYG